MADGSQLLAAASHPITDRPALTRAEIDIQIEIDHIESTTRLFQDYLRSVQNGKITPSRDEIGEQAFQVNEASKQAVARFSIIKTDLSISRPIRRKFKLVTGTLEEVARALDIEAIDVELGNLIHKRVELNQSVDGFRPDLVRRELRSFKPPEPKAA